MGPSSADGDTSVNKLSIYSHVTFSEQCESEAGAAEYVALWDALLISLSRDFDLFVRQSPVIVAELSTAEGNSVSWIAKTRFSFGAKRV